MPDDITDIFPEEIIKELTNILKNDISDTLKLLKENYFTPAVVMASHVFENMMFHYFDEDFFQAFDLDQEDEDDEEYEDDEDEDEEQPYNQKINFNASIWDYNSWNNEEEYDDEEEDEDDDDDDDDDNEEEYPSSLFNLIEKLEDFLQENVIDQMIELKNTRNESCHGNKRYSKQNAFNFVRKVLKVVVLVYNGNFGKLPE